jgi:hypothetical protein
MISLQEAIVAGVNLTTVAQAPATSASRTFCICYVLFLHPILLADAGSTRFWSVVASCVGVVSAS